MGRTDRDREGSSRRFPQKRGVNTPPRCRYGLMVLSPRQSAVASESGWRLSVDAIGNHYYSVGTALRTVAGSQNNPPRTTAWICRVRRISRVGSASRMTRLASSPGEIVPSQSCWFNALAFVIVAAARAAAGDSPDSTSSSSSWMQGIARRHERFRRIGSGQQRHARPVQQTG